MQLRLQQCRNLSLDLQEVGMDGGITERLDGGPPRF